MNITIVGTGYVGLVTGACLAEAGHVVTCVDSEEDKVAALRRGEAFLHEDGLQDILDRHAGSRLRATTDLAAAVAGSELTMIAVGTPSIDGRIDLRQVRAAARQVGDALRSADNEHVVVVKSTVVPGTTDDVVRPILEDASGRRVGRGLGLAMNPEFLREGSAVVDFRSPDRVVLGVTDPLAERRLRALYDPLSPADVLVTTPRTAEIIKYAANALLATLISFSNEIGNISARLPGVDVRDVFAGVQLDRRLSPILPDGRRIRPGVLRYLAAGCGFGGSCFPKDVQALRSFARDLGVDADVLDATLATNDRQPAEVVRLLDDGLGDVAGRRIAVLGVAFKPGTDDVRASPSLAAIDLLRQRGATVVAFDPVAQETARAALPDSVPVAESLAAAVDRADGIALMTAWPEFAHLGALLEGADPPPLVVDGRRMLEPDAIRRYAGIGLGPDEQSARPPEGGATEAHHERMVTPK